MCLFSLRTMIKESDCNYMIMELTLIEMNKVISSLIEDSQYFGRIQETMEDESVKGLKT